MKSRSDDGFSAVELLITLFIATIFLIAGYQLYTSVQRNGVESDQFSRASNVGYDYLRRYTSKAQSPCSSSVPSLPTDQPITAAGLNAATVTITITCPYDAISPGSNVSSVTATIKYNNDTPKKEVSHAIFVTAN